jgi:hypothetical protein
VLAFVVSQSARLQWSGRLPDKPVTQNDRDILVHRTGMRFLFRNTQLREHIENHARLDFQFPRQLVDANLLHKEETAEAKLSTREAPLGGAITPCPPRPGR